MEPNECSVCLAPIGKTFYRTGYKTGRHPQKPDERTYCGDDCRSFGRLHQGLSLTKLPEVWRDEQNYLKCSNHFLYAANTKLTPEAACDHNWVWLNDWYGDPDVPNGTQDCSRWECSNCGEEPDDTDTLPEPDECG